MDVAILTVGSELLRGDGLDTNSQWLSQQLEGQGHRVRLHASVLDDEGDIVRALEAACTWAPLVFVTGGLGPTNDDLTRAAVARTAGVALRLDPDELAHIEALFQSFGRTMSPSNRRQAELPEGARALRNEVGTAPAFALELRGARVWVLPGVPREMRWLWERHIEAELRALAGRPRVERTFRTVGIGESVLGERLAPVEAVAGIEVRYAAEELEGTVRVTLLGEEEARVLEAWELARRAVGEAIVSEGAVRLPEAVIAALRARGQTLTIAESCTGGRVAAALIRVPGASEVFDRGLVTYSDRSKQELLGVPASLIDAEGAVCEQVARAMARGARAAGRTTIGLGVTGIAGPDGGSPDKPVGTVHLAVAWGEGPEDSIYLRARYPGGRELVQARAAAGALKLILDASARAGGHS
ncbi:MAG: CinA family nicotinamide mononucleotide deamidase-related protein [Planctomycetota bacterium]